MSDQSTAGDACTLEVARLFERINSGRKVRSLPPVEYSAMASRCNLRFNLDKSRDIDFTQEKVSIARKDIDALEQLVNEQFDCMLDGVVAKLCIKPKKSQPVESVPVPERADLTHQQQTQNESESGLLSKIKKIFG